MWPNWLLHVLLQTSWNAKWVLAGWEDGGTWEMGLDLWLLELSLELSLLELLLDGDLLLWLLLLLLLLLLDLRLSRLLNGGRHDW